MISKAELRYSLDTIVVDILDDIIAPLIGEAPGILKIDPQHTNLEEFFEQPLDSQRAIRRIIEKYQLPKFTQEYIDEDFSFIQLALVCLLEGKYNEDWRPFK
jgi:hypothetical protein